MVLSETLNDWMGKILKAIGDVFAAILIFLLVVFVAGELWAMTFMRADKQFMLMLPVGLLMLILFVKAVE